MGTFSTSTATFGTVGLLSGVGPTDLFLTATLTDIPSFWPKVRRPGLGRARLRHAPSKQDSRGIGKDYLCVKGSPSTQGLNYIFLVSYN